jgi:hypothetical protein
MPFFEEYLRNSQQNKIYVMYENGLFSVQEMTLDEITPVDYLKSKTGYTCFSRTGRICQLMLR